MEHGPWQTRGYGRVAPPTPDKLEAIAKLFQTSTERVAAMIAADWYDVQPKTQVSARVLRIESMLDKLTDSDADMVEALARRLARA